MVFSLAHQPDFCLMRKRTWCVPRLGIPNFKNVLKLLPLSRERAFNTFPRDSGGRVARSAGRGLAPRLNKPKTIIRFSLYAARMLLSVDWDYFSGCIEHVFDAPIWGSRDTPFDRLEAWQARADKRNGDLSHDFPLLEDWRVLKQLEGIPAFATLSHADAYGLLEQLDIQQVLNLDSHHDLFSSSGDPNKIRPGNWAGLALEHGFMTDYTCIYPSWHEHLPVAEGFDLERTRTELGGRFSSAKLERGSVRQLELVGVEYVLLVQSPAWTNPEHDVFFFELCDVLKATMLEPPLQRSLLEVTKSGL